MVKLWPYIVIAKKNTKNTCNCIVIFLGHSLTRKSLRLIELVVMEELLMVSLQLYPHSGYHSDPTRQMIPQRCTSFAMS